MAKRRLGKILLFTSLFGVLLVVVALFALLMALPSPEKVGQLIGGQTDSNSEMPAGEVKPPVDSETQIQKPEATQVAEKSAPSPSTSAAAPEKSDQRGNRLIEGRYLNQTESVTPQQICSSLGSGAPSSEDQEGFMAALDRVENQGEASALVESVLLPVGQLLTLPTVNSVLKEAEEAKKNGESGIFRKAAFYSKIASAVTEIYTHSDELNRVADVGYYLYILSKVTQRAPGVRANPAMYSLCEEMVSAPPNSEDEQRELASTVSRFIKEAGLEEREVGFNPSYRTQLDVRTSQNSLVVGMGWLNEIFKSK